ncbi:MAG: secretin N-terminal domain-containing protein [Candidatus Omnitrophica bacterium]|nr:secretin N-terminal domain-containing protein [Candidatus Omnitrophota bacterium]MDD5237997.1 secretin N-terminal domain-containing protein [Candidatus Omnitrophota bacterium]
MKRIFSLNVFIFLFITLFLPELNADSRLTFPDAEPTISMDFQDVNLKDILKVLSIQSGLNFIASEAVQDRRVTLYLDKVPLKVAMDKLFAANNLSYELERDSNIFVVKDWGKAAMETITRVFYLKHATVSTSSLKEDMADKLKPTQASTGGGLGGAIAGVGGSGGGGGEGKWAIEKDTGITTAIKKLLSDQGSIIEDFRTNSLIVTDTPNRMPVIAQVIASLDIAVPQVLLEVEMLDVSKNAVDKLGFDWTRAGKFEMSITSAARSTGFPFAHFWPGSNAAGGTGYSTGTVNFNNPTIALDFLSTQTDTKFLARPRLRTLNNETAEIRIATNEAIGVNTTTQGTTTTQATAERTETGVLLRVTPQIIPETGEITMLIFPKISEASLGSAFVIGGASYQFKDPEERSTKSLVRVKDGETVILGGMIRNEYNYTNSKIPFLGDLPIIGMFFRHKGLSSSSTASDKNKQRELLVFITPHIIKDTPEIQLTQTKKLASLPEREQETVSAPGRESAIKTSIETFEKKR